MIDYTTLKPIGPHFTVSGSLCYPLEGGVYRLCGDLPGVPDAYVTKDEIDAHNQRRRDILNGVPHEGSPIRL